MAVASLFPQLFLALALSTIPLLALGSRVDSDVLPQDGGFRTELSRRHSNLPMSKRIQNSRLRASYLSSKATTNRGSNGGTGHGSTGGSDLTSAGDVFTVPVFLGTPAQRMDFLFDTTGYLVSVECMAPAFNYTRSSTFQMLPCSDTECTYFNDQNCADECQSDEYSTCLCSQDYGSNIAARDSVSLYTSSSRTALSLVFGCSFESLDIDGGLHGIASFDRSPISLISQLSSASSIPNTFSYCLSSSGPSPFFYGNRVSHLGVSNAQTIPLLEGTLYYVNLTSITVGSVNIPMTVSHGQDTNGTILDVSADITSVPPSVYNRVRSAFSSRISLPVVDGTSAAGLELCYNISRHRDYTFPAMTLHFEDVSVPLSQDNVMVVPSRADVSKWNELVACLALVPTGRQSISVIGNVMQQGHYIAFDNDQSTVSFASLSCSDL